MDETELLAQRFEANRQHLRSVAYRMLGSRSEAEDAVQEAWLRLSRAEPATVENLTGWLTTVVGRVCLDVLRSRKMRHEEAIGREAEAVANDDDAERDMVLADSIGMAMLAVLNTLSPPERVAFVLHDMFNLPFDDIAAIVDRSPAAARQLASRARQRVQGKPALSEADRQRQREIVNAFLTASRGGDFSALLAVLDPNVVLRADAAAMAASAARASQGAPELRGPETHGREPIAKLFHGRAKGARLALVDGSPGLVVPIGGTLAAVFEFIVENGAITEIALTSDARKIEAMALEY
ncbi:MAG: sigma-70 family RNA polymerase sigma factor [Proteobacteria bacterium]|nr:sigma-70 family RNA polymerase sigma factor [Pseudomonadota bacterium]